MTGLTSEEVEPAKVRGPSMVDPFGGRASGGKLGLFVKANEEPSPCLCEGEAIPAHLTIEPGPCKGPAALGGAFGHSHGLGSL